MVHYFLASQIENEIYDKVAGVTPAVNACDFMGMAVEHAEEIRMTKSNIKKEDTQKTDALFYVKDNVREIRVTITKERSSKNCFNCGNNDHLIRDCPNCLYCKKMDHDAYRCYKRRDDNVPYCSNCKKVDCQLRSKSNIVKSPQNTKYYTKGNYNSNSNVKSDKKERLRIVEEIENPNMQDGDYENEESSE